MELKADCCDVNLFNSANNFVAMGSFFGHKDGSKDVLSFCVLMYVPLNE